MTYYKNLEKYFSDGALYAKKHSPPQPGFRISFDDIVARRGTQFTTPDGTNINNYVPFYFSPITKMAYTIHAGKVPLKDTGGVCLGKASMDDVAFIVVEPGRLFASGRRCWFTDIACNSRLSPVYKQDPKELTNHIEWSLFDDQPMIGQIPEIGYEGVCRWQQDRDDPARYQSRGTKRMAEFMVLDYLEMTEVSCIVLKNDAHLAEIQSWVKAASLDIPVLVKPGCYF